MTRLRDVTEEELSREEQSSWDAFHVAMQAIREAESRLYDVRHERFCREMAKKPRRRVSSPTQIAAAISTRKGG